MHVGVMGAGSLGSLIGGLLAGQHRVTLVGREPNVKAVAQHGLRITGRLERTVHPAATTHWTAVEDPDLAIITVKAYDTVEAAGEVAKNPPPTAVTLQNGLGTVAALDRALAGRTTILAGTATYGALLEEPGVVRCTGQGEVAIGKSEGGRSPEAERVARAFTEAGLACTAATDMPRRRWEKLAINAAINPATALARVKNGALQAPPLRQIAEAAAREVATIARNQGIDLDPDAVAETVVSVAAQTAENESSMARDVRRGRRTELDEITGAILDRADDTPAPVNRVLYGLLAGWERGAGLRAE